MNLFSKRVHLPVDVTVLIYITLESNIQRYFIFNEMLSSTYSVLTLPMLCGNSYFF